MFHQMSDIQTYPRYSSETSTFSPNYLAMNKQKWQVVSPLQSVSGVGAINPLVVYGGRESCFYPDHTWIFLYLCVIIQRLVLNQTLKYKINIDAHEDFKIKNYFIPCTNFAQCCQFKATSTTMVTYYICMWQHVVFICLRSSFF
jgi:hypothetical protein